MVAASGAIWANGAASLSLVASSVSISIRSKNERVGRRRHEVARDVELVDRLHDDRELLVLGERGELREHVGGQRELVLAPARRVMPSDEHVDVSRSDAVCELGEELAPAPREIPVRA